MLIEPFVEELIKVNQAARMKSEKITEKLTKAKDRILKKIRCGLSTYEETNMPYSESYFFRYKFASKALLVALQRPCSRNVDKILKYRAKRYIADRSVSSRKPLSTAPDLADQPYNPESIVTSHRQKHKWLSDNEIKQIIQMYGEGYSTSEIARRYGCHKNTVSRHLKKAGVTVSNKTSTRDKLLIDNVLRMNAISMKAVDIGKELGISESTVRRLIRENDVRIQK